MVRGINKMSIFNSDYQKTEYLRRVKLAKDRFNIELLAYQLCHPGFSLGFSRTQNLDGSWTVMTNEHIRG
jgi:hypothetical protein